jgi:hypothetical protein
MADLEDALKKLDRLTQEEARMAHAEVLRLAHSIRDGVNIVDGKVGDVGDKVQCVDDRVQVVIEGARGLSSRLKRPSNIYPFRRQTSESSGEGHRRQGSGCGCQGRGRQ